MLSEPDQAVLLQMAMDDLEMSRDMFAEWLNIPKRRLVNWMQKPESPERRPMEPLLWKWLPAMVAFEKQQRSLHLLSEYVTMGSR